MTAEKQQDGTDKPEKPFFEIVGGNPSATEVGVLAAVFATAQGNAANGGHDTEIKNDWGAYEDRLRPPFGYNPNSFLNRRQY
ncbi:acyl-CoA carboxylase subunit epsilon [Dietzia sp. CH92]|uniref:acyl-CoA carboxylase subunit epsilon n=1 Tax=Dietzia sp. CH92 TaxID=3051823 RepID=UPI0028D8D3F9|nr:acyl-CoA carboxylase subunit epsilon [Dietzia sp. CH92]